YEVGTKYQLRYRASTAETELTTRSFCLAGLCCAAASAARTQSSHALKESSGSLRRSRSKNPCEYALFLIFSHDVSASDRYDAYLCLARIPPRWLKLARKYAPVPPARCGNSETSSLHL